ncbi:MAG TPA: CotH kinase family protein [Chitinispirillaceae bacterium]|nr:CotH kinase family protein [Chitinispirillaceae bacterium]
MINNINMNNTTFFFFTLLSAISQLTAATFSGQVIDAETGRGQAGVSVTLQNATQQTVSDSTGAFSLTATLGVRNERTGLNSSPLLRYVPQQGGFTIFEAAKVQSFAIYSLQGHCIAKVSNPGTTDFISLAIPAHGVYLLSLRTAQQAFTSVWNHIGTTETIVPIPQSGRRLEKRGVSAAAPSLLFDKSGYQQKKVAIVAGKDYSAMQVAIKPLIGDYIFNDDTVRTYRLYLSDSEIERFLDLSALVSGYRVNDVWVTGKMVFEDRSLDSIRVRFRGDQSLWDCVSAGERKKDVHYPQYGFGNSDVCAKFSMKCDFNHYNPDARLYSLKALNFRSMSFDPTKLHERLGFSLFHDMGINAPRVAHAQLYVNDSLWGLFSVVEEIDGRFTKSRYPLSGDGNLYKELWPESAAYESSILSALETNNNPEDNPDVSDFLAFRDCVISDSTDSSTFLDKVSKFVDIAHLVRYLAVDRGIGNFDGIVSAYYLGNGHMRHNFFWYHNDKTGLLELIPWDFDKVLLFPEPNFWSNNQPSEKNPVPNWNVVNSDYSPIECTFDPGPFGSYGVEPIDADKFLRLLRSTTWNQFTTQSRRFLDSCFTSAKVDERIEKWRRQIASAAGRDRTIDSTEWSVMVDSLRHTIPLMRTNLQKMIDTLITK